MSNAMFDRFNALFGAEMVGLKKDVDDAASRNKGSFKEVPCGDYEVKVVKLELGETGEQSKNPGMPMAKVWFDILAGDYKGQKIFMNQMLTTGFGIHKFNEFLSSLQTGIPVMFDDFSQYGELIAEIFREIDGNGEYALEYGKNKAGYNTYEITKRFA